MICHENRALQCFQQCVIINVGIGIMDKYARIHITVCIDMEITSSTCNTSAYIFCVILEIHAENRLGLTEFTDLMIHFLTLLWIWHQLYYCIVSCRHIMEEPYKQSSTVNNFIKIFLTAYTVHIGRGIACRNTKRKLVGLQQFHSMHDFGIYSLSTASVICFLRTFQTDSRNKVLYTEHFLAEFLIDQSSVCKGKELTVRIFLTDTDQVFFADQRFTACINIHVCTKLSALLYNRTDGVKIKVQLMSIFCCPASCAVQITGTGRIQQNCPWYITVIFLRYLFLNGTALQAGINDKVGEE